jgi:hypothetical protein
MPKQVEDQFVGFGRCVTARLANPAYVSHGKTREEACQANRYPKYPRHYFILVVMSALKLNSQSCLSFAAGQILQRLAEGRGYLLQLPHRGWIRTIQRIEELNYGLNAQSITNREAFRKPYIEIGIGRRLKMIAPSEKIDSVQNTIAVYVYRSRRRSGKMKTALCACDTAELKLPEKSDDPIQEQGMIESQV